MVKKSDKNDKKEPEKAIKDKKTACKKEEIECQEEAAGYYTEKQRDSKIRRVRNQLLKEYKELNPKENLSVESTINRMAFLAVHIEEQEKIINRDGTIEEYKNGENQFGLKDSTATKVHDRMFNDFLKAKKQLDDMRPKEPGAGNPAQTILDFVNQTNNVRQKNGGRCEKSC